MSKKTTWTVAGVLGSAVSALALEVGDPAPNFTAPATGGEPVSLEALRGQWVVLYFYPKADTPGCTKQSCSLRDGYADLKDLGVTLIGASLDDLEAQEAFKKKYNLPFPLIADKDGKVVAAYGVRGRVLPMAQRKTFVIDPNGNIAHVFDNVDVGRHQEEVLEVIRKLQAGTPSG
jgi:peroxiredoxin Q/BCP